MKGCAVLPCFTHLLCAAHSPLSGAEGGGLVETSATNQPIPSYGNLHVASLSDCYIFFIKIFSHVQL